MFKSAKRANVLAAVEAPDSAYVLAGLLRKLGVDAHPTLGGSGVTISREQAERLIKRLEGRDEPGRG